MSNIVSLQLLEDVRRSAGFELLEFMSLAVAQAWKAMTTDIIQVVAKYARSA